MPGKRNVDGYQAIWEHLNKRPMVYPKPRYSRPFMMDPANYEWVPVAGKPGIAEKLPGVFTERRSTAAAYYRALMRLDVQFVTRRARTTCASGRD